MSTAPKKEAILLVSFGGPEKPDDVMPFLENVLRGRNVPHERMLEVAAHYDSFGGKSPINDQCRALIAALRDELDRVGDSTPIYWGNRNWHPFLNETMQTMANDGITDAVALVTSAFSSYSGCRQYRENIEAARAAVGDRAPQISIVRRFFNHPSFIEASASTLRDACESAAKYGEFTIAFTAHSIPSSMAATCSYEEQLREAARLLSAEVGQTSYDVVYQSRSGPPQVPWLAPDILEHLRALHARGVKNVVVAPIGFLSDHMEVVFDLDVQAKALAEELGMHFTRANTVGTHPAFVRMWRELIAERRSGTERKSLGVLQARPDECAADCCPAPRRG